MCGRFTLRTPAADWLPMFKIGGIFEIEPRYNIAPTQMIAAIRDSKESKSRELTELKWGLIPSWAKDKNIGARMINARGETVAEKPSFRSAFKKRRCIIVADGFYEWKKIDKKTKQPHYICMKDREPFALAGLWEYWNKGEDGETIASCTIITTEANEVLEPLHDRMPVILSSNDFDAWLDPEFSDADFLKQKLLPFDANQIESFPVSTFVNNARNESPNCLDPPEQVDEPESGDTGLLF